MCKDISTSLVTFAFVSVAMTIVWFSAKTPHMHWLALTLWTISTMQLSDAALWYSIQTQNPTLNQIITRHVVPFILSLELLVSFYGARYFVGYDNRLLEVIIWVFIGAMIGSWYILCNKSDSTKAPDGYLQWCNLKLQKWMRWTFLVLLLYPFALAYPNDVSKFALFATTIGTFLYNYERDTFGARWCWSSNILALVLLFTL